MVEINPFRFEWSDGPIHRLNPVSKLISLLFLAAATMNSVPFGLIFVAIFCYAIILIAGVRACELVRNSRFLLPLAFFIVAMRVIDPANPKLFALDQLAPSAIYLARLALTYLVAQLFFRTTSTTKLADSLTRLARIFFGRSDIDPGFFLSLAIAFVPRSFEAYGRASEAALTRGFSLRRTGFRGIGRFLEAFLISSIRSALLSAIALEARGYNPGRTLHGEKMGLNDFLIPLLIASFSIILLILSQIE